MDKEIALRIGISVHTLHTYWKRIRAKFGYHTRAALISEWARRRGPNVEPEWSPFSRWTIDFIHGAVAWYEPVVSSDGGHSVRMVPMPARVIHPDDFTEWTNAYHALVRRDQDAATCGFRVISPRGVTFVHALGTAVYNSAPEPRMVIGYAVETLEDPFEPLSVTGGTWVSNRNRGLFWADEQCCRLFGLDYADSMDGRAFLDRIEAGSGEFEPFFGGEANEDGADMIANVEVAARGHDRRTTHLQAAMDAWPNGQVLAFGQVMTIETDSSKLR